MHEVTGHLKRKAHRVVLPHSFYHAILIVLQEEDPRVIYLLITLGPGRTPDQQRLFCISARGFSPQQSGSPGQRSERSGDGQPWLSACRQETSAACVVFTEPRLSSSLEACPLRKAGRDPSACILMTALHGCHLQKRASAARWRGGMRAAEPGTPRGIRAPSRPGLAQPWQSANITLAALPV